MNEPRAPQPPVPTRTSPAESCTSCGQPLRPGAVRCEFCGLGIGGRATAPKAPQFRICPHCGAEGIPLPGGKCPDCRESYAKPVSTSLRAKAQVSRALRSVKISAPAFAIGLIVLTGLTVFAVNLSYSRKSNTANNLRNITQRLKIANVESGGFPDDLGQLELRYGPIPPDWKVDAWGTPIRYTPGGEVHKAFDRPGDLHETCDLRSAGPNRKFDDDDDLAFQGKQE